MMIVRTFAALSLGVCLSALSAAASAGCTGTGNFKSCYDAQSGNSYSVQQIGNQTYTRGHNSSTGSSWSQTSQQIGNTTYHNGTSADGGSWRGTSTQIGNTTYHNGVDSNGNPYSGATNCGIAGCN